MSYRNWGVFLVVLALVSGCIYEADRQLASICRRGAEKVYVEGAAAGAPLVAQMATAAAQIEKKMGAPVVEPPLTAEAVAAAVTASDAGIERDRRREDMVFGWLGKGLGAVGLGGLAGVLELARRKKRRQVQAMIVGGQTLKHKIEDIGRRITAARGEDGKLDAAEGLRLLVELRGQVGPIFRDASALYNVGRELHDEYVRTAKKA